MKKKTILLLLPAIAMLAALPFLFIALQSTQDIRNKAAPATSLTFSPDNLTLEKNQTTKLSVMINTGENSVTVAKIIIEYDDSIFEGISLINGPMFPNILSESSLSPGRAAITVGALSSTQPTRGTGVAATLELKVKPDAVGSATIGFGKDTFIGGLSEGSKNLLIQNSPATITIGANNVPMAIATPTSSQLQQENAFTQSGSTTSPTPTASSQTIQTLSPTPSIQPTVTPDENVTTNASPSPTPTTSNTSAQIRIDSPIADSAVPIDEIKITGIAPPETMVTISIPTATPITASVFASSSGSWEYTLTHPIASGRYVITATAVVANGSTIQATSSFIAVQPYATPQVSDPIPVTGQRETLFVMIVIAVALCCVGVLLPNIGARNGN